MEFLVEIRSRMPPDLDPGLAEDIAVRERARGRELVAAGTIRAIWRIPGRRDNVGIWEAPDAAALHDAISSLPAFPWQDVLIRPLAAHPLDVRQPIAAREPGPGSDVTGSRP